MPGCSEGCICAKVSKLGRTCCIFTSACRKGTALRINAHNAFDMLALLLLQYETEMFQRSRFKEDIAQVACTTTLDCEKRLTPNKQLSPRTPAPESSAYQMSVSPGAQKRKLKSRFSRMKASEAISAVGVMKWAGPHVAARHTSKANV